MGLLTQDRAYSFPAWKSPWTLHLTLYLCWVWTVASRHGWHCAPSPTASSPLLPHSLTPFQPHHPACCGSHLLGWFPPLNVHAGLMYTELVIAPPPHWDLCLSVTFSRSLPWMSYLLSRYLRPSSCSLCHYDIYHHFVWYTFIFGFCNWNKISIREGAFSILFILFPLPPLALEQCLAIVGGHC